MWPWGHLAVGYLSYVAWLRVRGASTRTQTGVTVAAVGVGSQFPDIIDKPLAWTVPLLPSGRSLAHSLIIATVVIAVTYRISQTYDYEDTAIAFGVGYVSHSLSDLGPTVVWGLLRGDVSQLEWTTYLLWPLLSSPPYPLDSSFQEHIVAFQPDAYVVFQFALAGVALAVWKQSGEPGLSAARTVVHRFTTRE
jgi:membrane-bound metal-dependent hydrolase YbcI (DUF457 family)